LIATPAAGRAARSAWSADGAAPGLLLLAPALLMVALLFLYPLGISLLGAFRAQDGAWTLANFAKSHELYSRDIAFTVAIIGLSTLLIGAFSVAIGGYLTLGENTRAVAILRWLYRWPLFIPFVVAGQLMRAFLARNGMLNNTLMAAGVLDPADAQSFLDWRGIVIAFVWKQTPFAALLVAGAMASLDRSTIEAARNLGAGRLRILLEIVVPQVRQTLIVALVLSFVTMMSVLSVPLMINAQSPTMITVDMAFRINAYGDYGVANALGLISCLFTGTVAWIYLRLGNKERSRA
jgi:ABC-type sugar transport system permease subunit